MEKKIEKREEKKSRFFFLFVFKEKEINFSFPGSSLMELLLEFGFKVDFIVVSNIEVPK